MKTENELKEILKARTDDLINSKNTRMLGVPGIMNDDELKGYIKALRWVLE